MFLAPHGWSASKPSRYGSAVIGARNDVMVGLDPGQPRWSGGSARAWWTTRPRSRSWTRAPPRSPTAAASELIWLLEHPPLYTAGTSAKADELIAARFPVHAAGRGGQFTYHGPGQRVAYVMLDLKRRGPDVRRFVATLEEWIIRTLASFDVAGERRADRIGVWVRRPDKGAGLRGQDRGHRHQDQALGHAARSGAQCRLRSLALRRHRALRGLRAALRRHQPRRSRPRRDAHRDRRGAAARIRARCSGRLRAVRPLPTPWLQACPRYSGVPASLR